MRLSEPSTSFAILLNTKKIKNVELLPYELFVFQNGLSVKTVKRIQLIEETRNLRSASIFQFFWTRNNGINLETLFEGLLSSLHADITLSLYREIIGSVPLLQDTEIGFTKMLTLYNKPLLLPKFEGKIFLAFFFAYEGCWMLFVAGILGVSFN